MTYNNPLDATDSYNFPLAWSVAEMCLSVEWTKFLKKLGGAVLIADGITIHGHT